MWTPWWPAGLGAAALAMALVLGGRDERLFGAAKAAALGVGFVRSGAPATSLARDALVHLALLAVVLPLALRSAKAWPLATASICLAALMTTGAQRLVQAAPPAYGIVQCGWGLLGDGVIAVGAWNAWRARRSRPA